jgi:ribulose-5-phosphate 4-epimerase/fuculose-1-phosphate aldolase
MALYKDFRGVVVAEDEGIEIAKALGDKKAALLQNHGLLTCGISIEACVFWFMSLDKCCHTQLLADAAVSGRGQPFVTIADDDAAHTHEVIGHEGAGRFSAKPIFDMMIHTSGDEYKN